MEAYKKAIQLEPTSQTYKDSLAAAEKKLQNTSSPSTSPAPSTTGSSPAATPQMPNLGNLGAIFNNPQFMSMMNNVLGGSGTNTGTGTGQAPNIGELLNNPMLQTMAQQMMSNPAMMSMYELHISYVI